MTELEQHPLIELQEAKRAGCTDKQIDVLKRRAAGHSWKRIARDLGISPQTAHGHADAAHLRIKRYHEETP